MNILQPIPFEVIGAGKRRASEIERDRAAIELAAYIIGILKFDPGAMASHADELLKRANKVRRTQGNGEVSFISDTAEKIRAAASPAIAAATYEETQELVAAVMSDAT